MMDEILVVKNVNNFFGRKQVLKNVSFSLSSGRITGLVGANGAGKTTIMKTILSLTPYAGQIMFEGQPSTFNDHPLLSDIGALIEYPSIYPFMTGMEHLRLFARSKVQSTGIQSLIHMLNMEGYINSAARGYSLGMRQKLGVAMAFVNNPKLVILDEPMNGLDPQSNKELRDLIIDQRNRGVSFLISSHILSELQKLAEDLIIVDQGKVVRQTTMKNLLEANNHFIVLNTSDDKKAQEILIAAGYYLVSGEKVRIKTDANFDIAEILTNLISENIAVHDVKHEDEDLEGSVLELLNTAN